MEPATAALLEAELELELTLQQSISNRLLQMSGGGHPHNRMG